MVSMNSPIYFNCESSFSTIEIQDESAQRMLSPELVTTQTLGSKMFPELFFSLGWILTVPSAKVNCVV